jgi:hypothetical protein
MMLSAYSHSESHSQTSASLDPWQPSFSLVLMYAHATKNKKMQLFERITHVVVE